MAYAQLRTKYMKLLKQSVSATVEVTIFGSREAQFFRLFPIGSYEIYCVPELILEKNCLEIK